MPLSLCYDTDDGVLIVADWGSDSITFLSYEEVYPVQLSETGLPHGTNWSLEINDTTLASTSPRIVVFEPNGTYNFTIGIVSGFTSDPAGGEVMVAGLGENVTIAYERQFEVTFGTAGLPTGTRWAVTLNGSTNESSTSSVDFAEPNGTYPYTVGAIAGYAIATPSGYITVNGRNVTVTVQFTPLPPETYMVYFTESGLAAGTSWAVDFNNVTQRGNGAQIDFGGIPNGTFSFIVPAVSGYYEAPSFGLIGIVGGNHTENVVFTVIPPHVEASATWNEVSATGLCGPPGTYSLTVHLFGNATGGTLPYTYSWDFGDGSPVSALQNPEHTYTTYPYIATLTVTDARGNQSSTSVTIPGVTATCTTVVPVVLQPSLIVLGIGAGLGIVVGLVAYRRKE